MVPQNNLKTLRQYGGLNVREEHEKVINSIPNIV